MSTIRFVIRYENGRSESASVDGERALVGSASHCDVRLPMEEAADEQLLVELAGGTLRATARADEPRALLDGVPLRSAILSEGSLLSVGRVRLTVTSSAEREREGRKQKGKGSSLQLAIVALATVVCGGMIVLMFANDGELAPAPARAPELFSDAAPECPKQEKEAALAFAEEQKDMAIATHERVPFAAHEGVAAVGLYQTAAACFRKAGAAERGADAEQAASTLKGELEDDFRARRLRLSHVLELEDFELAKLDLGVLRALTAGKSGPYVEWLNQVEKQLKAKEDR